MKKTILLLAILVIALSSCSSDDGTMKITYQNMAGKWNFKSFVKSDGSVVPYTGRCSTQKDYAEIFNYGKVVTYNYYPNCVDTDDFGSPDFILDLNTHMVYSTTYLFNEATITHLTKSGFKLEFPEPRNLMGEFGVSDVKVVIFEKRQ